MASEFTPKMPVQFEYTPCEFSCYNRKDYKRHLCTRKHMGTPKIPSTYVCDVCTQVYKHRSSLCKHKKNCKPKQNIDLYSIVNELVQSNLALQKQMAELCNQIKSPSDVL
jgi:hypothetical protein